MCLRTCKLQGSMKTIQPSLNKLLWLSGARGSALSSGTLQLERFLRSVIRIVRRRSGYAICIVACSLSSLDRVGIPVFSANQTRHLQANLDLESTSLVSPAINSRICHYVQLCPSCRTCVREAVWARLLRGVPGRSRLWEAAGCWGGPCNPTGNSEATRTCLNQ